MNKRNIAGDSFVLTASDFRWESGLPDDPDDLCLHGMARANIGDETVEYDDTNLTAASLHLLRTINADHIARFDDEQLFPHCGHDVYLDENGNAVVCCCHFGGDFSVRHEDGKVTISTISGCTVTVDNHYYAHQVREFASSVREYCERSAPKREPREEYLRLGWQAFWHEWNMLCDSIFR